MFLSCSDEELTYLFSTSRLQQWQPSLFLMVLDKNKKERKTQGLSNEQRVSRWQRRGSFRWYFVIYTSCRTFSPTVIVSRLKFSHCLVLFINSGLLLSIINSYASDSPAEKFLVPNRGQAEIEVQVLGKRTKASSCNHGPFHS